MNRLISVVTLCLWSLTAPAVPPNEVASARDLAKILPLPVTGADVTARAAGGRDDTLLRYAVVNDRATAKHFQKAPREYEMEPAPHTRMEVAQSTTDTGQANRLLIDAVKAVEAAKLAPSATQKFALLQQADEYLTAIIERFPSTDLAVRLATGQKVGDISVAGVRRAMNEARETGPGTLGVSPTHSWRHAAAVVAVALSANGRRAVTASSDGLVTVRNLDTGEILRTWQHQDSIVAAAASRDGRRLVTVSWDGVVAVWNTQNGKRLANWRHDEAPIGLERSRFSSRGVFVKSLALSPNGRYVLAANGFKAHLIDVNVQEIVHTWRYDKRVFGVAYSPNGRQVLLLLAGGRVRLNDASTGQTLREWRTPEPGSWNDYYAAFSPDGQRVAIAVNSTVVLHDLNTGKDLRKWRPGGSYNVLSIAFSPDGQRVFTGDKSYEATLYDVNTGKVSREWRYEGKAPVDAVAFSADGRQALMGFRDGVVMICDSKARNRTRSFLKPGGEC